MTYCHHLPPIFRMSLKYIRQCVYNFTYTVYCLSKYEINLKTNCNFKNSQIEKFSYSAFRESEIKSLKLFHIKKKNSQTFDNKKVKLTEKKRILFFKIV